MRGVHVFTFALVCALIIFFFIHLDPHPFLFFHLLFRQFHSCVWLFAFYFSGCLFKVLRQKSILSTKFMESTPHTHTHWKFKNVDLHRHRLHYGKFNARAIHPFVICENFYFIRVHSFIHSYIQTQYIFQLPRSLARSLSSVLWLWIFISIW